MAPSLFGRLLKERRRAHDLTQERLAELVGCALVTLKKIEAGTLRPSRQVAERVAEILKIPPGDRADFVALARGERTEAQPIHAVERPDNQIDAPPLIAETVIPPLNPFKGLRAFQEADAPVFFGRSELVERLLQRLAHHQARTLIVVGASGSGKSSVVRAGLIPALRRNGIPGSAKWFLTTCVPGPHPLEEIEAALLRVAINPPETLIGQLRESTRGLLRAVKRVLPEDEDSELVLVIDQFEEIFTLVANEDERAHVLASLLTAVRDPRSRLRLVATLRADFFDRPLRYVGWDELLDSCAEVVTLLRPEQVAVTISGPAQHAGLVLEDGLVEAIVTDVRAQPGALPLLQYALAELFEHRSGSKLTFSSYRAIGGMAGALVRRAEELYLGLKVGGQVAARHIFLRLVTVEGEGNDTRRRVLVGDLTTPDLGQPSAYDPVGDVLERFGRYRLLTFDHDPITRSPTVEVAHEALIQRWERLRAWLDECRANLRLQQRLSAAATEWKQHAHDESFLATGARLHQFEVLLHEADLVLNATERAYLETSIAQQELRTAVEHAQQLALREQLTRAEAHRLASEALRLLNVGGSSELIALLAIRSMQIRYTPQGDEAVARAVALPLPVRIFPFGGISFSFGPHGKTVAFEQDTQPVLLFDMESGATVGMVARHDESVNCVRFSPDGSHIAMAYEDGTARIWDVADAERLVTCTGPCRSMWSIEYAPDGYALLTGASEPAVRLWDVTTGTEIRHFLTATPVIGQVAFSHDGCLVAAGTSDGRVYIWEVATGAIRSLLVGHSGAATAVAFAPDGERIATGGRDTSVRLWDLRAAVELSCCRGHTEEVNCVTFSPNGMLLASSGADGVANLWDAQTGRAVCRYVGYTAFVFSVGFTPDGTQLLTASGVGPARLWEVAAQPYLPVMQGVVAAFAPSGEILATGDIIGRVWLWDTATGRCLTMPGSHEAEVSCLAFSHDGSYFITGSTDGTARVWDVRAGRQLHVLRGHERRLLSVASSPDGHLMLSVSMDGTARLWDAISGAAMSVLAGHTNAVFDGAFSPDGQVVVTGAVDGTTRIWDVITGTLLHVLPCGASSVTFSQDGALLFTGAWDGVIRIWDFAKRELVGELIGHATTIWRLRAGQDGRSLLSASGDRTARLWDLGQRREVRQLAGHASAVRSVDLTPDGRHILTATLDGTVRLWDANYATTLEHLQNRLLRDFTDHERTQYQLIDSALLESTP